MAIERNRSVDILKGIGVILVVMGHNANPKYIGGAIATYIYSFHMPLFFLISGYLMKDKGNAPMGKFIKLKIKGIWIPYTALFVLSLLVTNTIYPMAQKLPPFIFPIGLKKLFLAYFLSSDYLNQIPCSNFPLWYLPLALVAMICFRIFLEVEKRLGKAPFSICLVVTAVCTVPFQSAFQGRPPLHINVLPAALVFLGLGYLFGKYESKLKIPHYLGVLIGTIGIMIAFNNGGSINQINNMIYFVGAVCSTYLYYAIAKSSSNSILAYIGRNSLFVYGVHSLVGLMYSFTGIEQLFLAKWDGIMIFLINVSCITAISTILCVVWNALWPQLKNLIILKSRRIKVSNAL